MKLAFVVLGLLGTVFQAQAECPACDNYVNELGLVLFSEENFAAQIELVIGLFCEEGDEACAEFVALDWPMFWEVVFAIDDLNNIMCSAMGADENCGDWESSTSDVDTCIARAEDFRALVENEAFDNLVDFLSSEEGYCGSVFCAGSDDPDCLEECYETEQALMPPTFRTLLEKMESDINNICEDVVSK